MPDPICPAAVNPDLSSSDPTPDELSCAAVVVPAAPNQCLPAASEVENAGADGASALVDKYSQKDYSAYIADASSSVGAVATPPSDNNAYRTTIRDAHGPYFDSGVTRDGDSVFAGTALVKSNGPLGAVELFSASGQAGAENESQIGVLRVAGSNSTRGFNLSGSLELATIRDNLGIHNDDGSKGANVGAMATLAGAEVTVERSGWSATAGLSASFGFAVSSGDGRDIDGDGNAERCFKLSIGPATLGFCTEL